MPILGMVIIFTLPLVCDAQFVDAAPRVITFEVAGHTLIPPEQLPMRAIGLSPSPFGVDRVPFKARIRLTNLPTGAETNFVMVSPSSGVAYGTSVIALNPKVVPFMRPGFYRLDVLFDNPERPEFGAGGVEVNLILSAPGNPEITSVVNSASMQPGISPGQLVTIRGVRLSSPPVHGEPDTLGLFPRVIGHTRVTFNGIPAPLLYVSTDQINCVVPFGVSGSASADVVVDLLHPSGRHDSSQPFTVPVAATSPGIFTANQSGSGAGAILNAGTGLNSESNPAPAGSAITFYATGAGAWNVPFPDGALVMSSRTGFVPPIFAEFITPAAPVSVSIGGRAARLVEATAQAMRVSGMLQITAEIPEGVSSGAQPVVLKIGANDSAGQNVTVWVR
jgi:uncharacterized protein (TIGR03437 family)